MDYLIYEICYTNLIVATKQIIITEKQMIKKGKTIIENYQTELVVQNIQDEKQGKYRTTRK